VVDGFAAGVVAVMPGGAPPDAAPDASCDASQPANTAVASAATKPMPVRKSRRTPIVMVRTVGNRLVPPHP
jgi:hypothetical protein